MDRGIIISFSVYVWSKIKVCWNNSIADRVLTVIVSFLLNLLKGSVITRFLLGLTGRDFVSGSAFHGMCGGVRTWFGKAFEFLGNVLWGSVILRRTAKFLNGIAEFLSKWLSSSILGRLLFLHRLKADELLAVAVVAITVAVRILLGNTAAFVLGVMFIVPVVLWKPHAGVWITAFLAPFASTIQIAVLCVACVISVLLSAICGKIQLWFRRLDLFVAAYAALYAFAAVTSLEFSDSIKVGALVLSFVLFYFAAHNAIQGRERLLKTVVVILSAGLVTGLWGILQNYTGIALTKSWVDTELFKNIGARVYGPFDNPNVLGVYLVLLLPLALGVFLGSKDRVLRVFGLASLGAMGLCLMYTWSRGAWLGAGVSVALFAILNGTAALKIAVFAVALLPFAMPASMMDRLLSVGNLKDSSLAYRLSIWLASLRIVRQFWLSGIGIGTDVFTQVYPKFALSGAAFALHSHNMPLQLWIETGILGISAFAVMLAVFYREIFANYRKGGDVLVKFIMITVAGGITGFLVQGIGDNVFYNFKMVMMFWLLLSLSVSAVSMVKGE